MATSFDNGLQVFGNWQTICVGLTIYIMTAAVRRIVEIAWKNAGQSKWWYEVLLPLGPIGNGILLAVGMRKFPWPEPIAGSFSARVMYAMICGLFCGWLYARVRGFMRQGSEVKGDEPSGEIPALTAPKTEEKVEEAKAAEPTKAEEPKADEPKAAEKAEESPKKEEAAPLVP